MLSRLLSGLEGKLSSSKWEEMTSCSPDTTLRDINDLVKLGVLVRSESGGRSRSYDLASLSANSRIGVAKGKFEVPDSIDSENAQIARMFEGS